MLHIILYHGSAALFVLTELKNVSTAIALPCYSDQNRGRGIRIAETWVPFPYMSGSGTSQNSDIHFLQCVCLLLGVRKWFFARLSCAGDRERSL